MFKKWPLFFLIFLSPGVLYSQTYFDTGFRVFSEKAPKKPQKLYSPTGPRGCQEQFKVVSKLRSPSLNLRFDDKGFVNPRSFGRKHLLSNEVQGNVQILKAIVPHEGQDKKIIVRVEQDDGGYIQKLQVSQTFHVYDLKKAIALEPNPSYQYTFSRKNFKECHLKGVDALEMVAEHQNRKKQRASLDLEEKFIPRDSLFNKKLCQDLERIHGFPINFYTMEYGHKGKRFESTNYFKNHIKSFLALKKNPNQEDVQNEGSFIKYKTLALCHAGPYVLSDYKNSGILAEKQLLSRGYKVQKDIQSSKVDPIPESKERSIQSVDGRVSLWEKIKSWVLLMYNKS